MAFYRTFAKKDYETKTRRFDFRFGITEHGFVGTFIFPALESTTPIICKGRQIGEASFSLIAGIEPKFILFARKDYKYAGQNPYKPIEFFETDITTGFSDNFKAKIYTGDYLQNIYTGETYEVFPHPKTKDFYLKNLRHRNSENYFSKNFDLTRGETYVIVGNRIEGIFENPLQKIKGETANV